MSRTIVIAIIFLCRSVFAESIAAQPKTISVRDQGALDELRREGYEALKQGNLEAAVRSYEEVVRGAEPLHVSAEELAQDLQSLGLLYSEVGRYSDAEKHFLRELEILQSRGNQSAIGRAYLSLAGVRQLEGAFSGAETSYKKAIEVFDLTGDKQEALALNGLGWLYTLWGRTADAERFLQKAWNSADKTLAADDPLRIRFLDTQASYLSTVGKYSEAEKFWKQALQIGDKAYPGDESKYGEVFLHLGQLYGVLGDYASAEDMFQRFLALDKHLGPDASVRAVVTAELARIYTDRRKYADAERLFTRSIQLLDSERDRVPLSYSLVQTYFGDYYMERSRWKDAETQYRSALKMRTTMLGENTTDVATSMFSLSKALRKLHRKKEADQYLAQALAIVASQKNPAYEADTIDVRAFRQK